MLVNTPPNGAGNTFMRCVEGCGICLTNTQELPQYLLDALHSAPGVPIPDILNRTFHNVDASLSRMCEESDGKIHSGCTAVTAFLRIEDDDGQQSFINEAQVSPVANSPSSEINEVASSGSGSGDSLPINGDVKDDKDSKSKSSGSRIRNALRSLGGGSSSSKIPSPTTPRSSSPTTARKVSAEGITITIPPSNARRVLYCANAGDARGVLCRNGKAVRLTYDHKGSDRQEAKRITDAGGFVLSGRVNGVLAVTRSLGDSSMKEFVVGAPYTTETELCNEDEFLILACDGVYLTPSCRRRPKADFAIFTSSGMSSTTSIPLNLSVMFKMLRKLVPSSSNMRSLITPLTMLPSLSYASNNHDGAYDRGHYGDL